jgi:alpha-1,2-mannosyltransferase
MPSPASSPPAARTGWMVRTVGTLAACVVSAALLAVAFRFSPVFGLDFNVYLTGGQRVLDGAGDLYIEGRGLPFTYPPFAALLFILLVPLGHGAGVWFFTLASLAIGAATAVHAVRHFCGLQRVRDVLDYPRLLPAAIVAFGLIILLGPWRETLGFGQINILLFGAIMADFLIRRRGWPTGLLTGIAAGLKLTPLVFGLYFLVRRDWGGLRNMAAGFLGTVVLGFVVLPRESVDYWFGLLADTARIGGACYVDNLSVKGAILHFAGPGYDVDLPWLLLSVALVAVAAVVIRLADDRGLNLAAVAATGLLMVLISPVSWSHHWVWIAVLLPVLARLVRELPAGFTGLRRVGAVLLLVSTAVFFYSPKTIASLFGASNLDAQEPTGWLMASSAGVFCSVCLLCFMMAALRLRPRAQPRPSAGQTEREGRSGEPEGPSRNVLPG